MQIDVAFLPREVEQEGLTRRCAVVFDVLRATTSMTAALAAGAREIRIFPSVSAARNAAAAPGMEDRPLLCGEEKCLAPAGFDLGNSPGAFAAKVNGKTLLMSTTNGTKAILAAGGAKLLLVGALVNASAVAAAVAQCGLDVTLICAGTGGKIAIEDVIGAGAVIDALEGSVAGNQLSDAARIARRLFAASKDDLRGAIGGGAGGRNVIHAGLSPDIDFAASLDRFADVVGCAEGTTVRLLDATR